MEMGMEYEISGRKVSQREWSKHVFEDEPRRLIRKAFERKFRRIRCAEHGGIPRVQFTNASHGFDLNIEGCCDGLVAQVEAALA